MTTSLSALTLLVYYRYLPIFKPEAMRSEDKRGNSDGKSEK